MPCDQTAAVDIAVCPVKVATAIFIIPTLPSCDYPLIHFVHISRIIITVSVDTICTLGTLHTLPSCDYPLIHFVHIYCTIITVSVDTVCT